LDDSTVDARRKKSFPDVIGQQREAMEAGEGQFVTMAGIVEMADLLLTRERVEHEPDRRGINTGGQAARGTQCFQFLSTRPG
jgi:hypothetical protein